MSAKKRAKKTKPQPRRMTATNAVFAELEAMDRDEQVACFLAILEWAEENDIR
jgi:hypothetical protein